MACLVAFVAWRWEPAREQSPQITYWDVAGALTLFGICVASQIDPDQMVRLVEGARRAALGPVAHHAGRFAACDGRAPRTDEPMRTAS